MASYRGHLAFSSLLGTTYGACGFWYAGLDWGPACLGAGLTALGGMLPDLDSDSSVPSREMLALAAGVTPLLLIHRLARLGLSSEQLLVLLGGVYLGIRYGVGAIFRQLTVHRGMFHSIPAMIIAGLVVYLLDPGPTPFIRYFLAGGVMLGYLSHLVLDALYGIDFMGMKPRFNQYAGSSLKLISASWFATLTTYGILAYLAYTAYQENSRTSRMRVQLTEGSSVVQGMVE